jgi:hypothetical protein
VTESGHSSPSVQPQLNVGSMAGVGVLDGSLQGWQAVVEVALLVGPRSSAGALKFQLTMLLEWLDTIPEREASRVALPSRRLPQRGASSPSAVDVHRSL